MKQVLVVGGGAAGMIAAIKSARLGCHVTLVEKNEKLGKKLYITGKGRCNLTNACDPSELSRSVVSNSKFLYSAFSSFSNRDTVDFFGNLGLKTKVERGNRVFPVSDKSSDVISALANECRRQNVEVRLHTRVKEILTDEITGNVSGIRLADGTILHRESVILAVGGVSYPGTGATDCGMRLAKNHNITRLRPGLVGLLTKENMKSLQGISCHICEVSITKEKTSGKRIFSEKGELLFTHFGVSGPMILSASSLTGDLLLQKGVLYLHIDFKPWQSLQELDRDILNCFDKMPNATIKKSLADLLPERLILFLLSQCGVSATTNCNQVSREQRERIRSQFKDLTLTLTGLRGLEEAIITRGGIDVKEVNPSTMESKRIPGLYFAGEMLDVDALTGGFNLQIAWSTGYLAGVCASSDKSAASQEK